MLQKVLDRSKQGVVFLGGNITGVFGSLLANEVKGKRFLAHVGFFLASNFVMLLVIILVPEKDEERRMSLLAETDKPLFKEWVREAINDNENGA